MHLNTAVHLLSILVYMNPCLLFCTKSSIHDLVIEGYRIHSELRLYADPQQIPVELEIMISLNYKLPYRISTLHVF